MIFFAALSLVSLVWTTSGAPTGSCTVNGNTFANGENYTASACMEYTCNNGTASIVREGCVDNQVCRAVDETWTADCVTYQCSKTVQDNVSTYSTSAVSSSCKDSDGVCHSPGETFPYTISGTTYSRCTCTVGATIQYSCASDNCNVNGNVYQNGQIFNLPNSSPCIKYQCSTGQVSLVEEGCQDGQTCRPLNQNWSNNCVTYTCSKSVQNNLSTYSTSVVSSSCKDASGVCHNPGETFPYVINGTTYNSCSCSKDANGQISYSCSSNNCNVNGNVYQNGEIFNLPNSSPCLKYQCTSGVASLIEEGCQDDQTCRPLNQNWSNNCVTYTCSKSVQNNLSTYSTSVVSSSCKDSNGVCHNPGETFPFTINGTTYNSCTCSKDANGQISYSCASNTCNVNENVYQNGEIFSLSSPCIKYQCSNGQASLLEEGCQDGQTCRPLNQNWTNNCVTYTCSKTVQNNLSTYSTSVVSSSCKDANGVCRNPGETFPFTINGTTYNSCTCSKDANGQIQYSCGSNTCNVNGNVYQNGQIFSLSSPCIKYQCFNGQVSRVEEGCQDGQTCRPLNQNWSTNCVTYTCSKTVQNNLSTYSTSVVSSSCKDANSVCHNPGETFPYIINGTTYNSCTCSKDANGQISYSCASNNCNVNGNVYQNSQVFSLPNSSPCIKYLCSAGQVSLTQEGCSINGACVAVNGTVVNNCNTYLCSKTVQNNVSSYSSSVVNSDCKDSSGNCHQPWETFSLVISGTTYNKCNCSKDATGSIKYSCTG